MACSNKKNRPDCLIDSSSQITDKLFSIVRHLAETTQRSADILDILLTSSDKVDNTRNELEHQEQVIVQSGKLLGKYELVHLDVNCRLDGLRVLHYLINRGYYDQHFSLRDATVSIKIVESNEKLRSKMNLESDSPLLTAHHYCSSKYPRELIDHAVHDRCCERRRSLKLMKSSPSLSKLWKTICVYLVGSPNGNSFWRMRVSNR
ncbi:uncharacterized protein LOC112589027 [Harpegnathos saltator]|uniref:uncharacterized protein LOC112589027 n=1 Tax=Harpegnathos saltator TaxID=610380 RepID=UPI000DBEDC54|nr:uncharacterized protein LOC112589027 [Harpegnathos saltator]